MPAAASWTTAAAMNSSRAAPPRSRSAPKAAGAKAQAAWLHAVTSATALAVSAGAKSCCAINGGKEVALPRPSPNSATPSSSSGTSVPPAPSSADEPQSCKAWLAAAAPSRKWQVTA